MEKKEKKIFPDESGYLTYSKEGIPSLKTKKEEQENNCICLGENVQKWLFDLTTNQKQVVGVFLGQIYQGENGLCLIIDGALQAKYVQGEEDDFHFTHESWQDLQAMQNNVYPQKKILGWFRTYSQPDILFSANDLVVQKIFFKQPWQVAYLFCPHSQQGVFFRWKEKEMIPSSFYSLSIGNKIEEKGKVLVSQKRRKRLFGRRLHWRRFIGSAILLIMVSVLTFLSLKFFSLYSDLISFKNLQLVFAETIEKAVVFVQNIIEVATQK